MHVPYICIITFISIQLQTVYCYTQFKDVFMTHSPTLSLFALLLISLNIMLGSGIFINTVLLAKTAQGLGALAYILIGILLLPLILSFSRLMRHHQGGTFYDFGATLHPLVGFISCWSYFTAKMASCALGIHIFVSLLRLMIPFFAGIPALILDTIIILLFSLLNIMHVHIGKSIQYSFIILKMIPITFAIISGIMLFQGTYFTTTSLPWHTLPATFPFVLYAFTGFEAICSLSRSIVNPEHNGPKAIILAYSLGVGIVVLYQFFFFGALGSSLTMLNSYLEAFPALIHKLIPHGEHQTLLMLLHTGIASSSLGAAYGIMYSNAWNLFALAHEGHVYGKKFLLKLNSYHRPYVCIIVENLLALSYVFFAQGHQIPLQQICSLGMTITYTLSVLALMYKAHKDRQNRIIPLLALGSCSILLGSLINNMLIFGIMPSLLFCIIIALGIGMFMSINRSVN